MKQLYQRMMGGQANQFFIELKNNELEDVVLEYSFYKDQYHWLYSKVLSLNGVAKRSNVDNDNDVILPFTLIEKNIVKILSLSFLIKLKRKGSIYGLKSCEFRYFTLIIDHSFHYSNLLNWSLNGFNLAEKYFGYCDQIVEDDYVVMHVRKGDFKGNRVYDICSKEWFFQAAKLSGKPKLWIVTDDLRWVESNLSGLDLIFEDLRISHGANDWSIMANSSCLIISNSTFSLTAATFRGNKRVIGPKQWSESKNIAQIFRNWIWI